MGGRLAGFMVLRWTPLSSDRTFSNFLFSVWKAVLGLEEGPGLLGDLIVHLEEEPSDIQSSFERYNEYQT